MAREPDESGSRERPAYTGQRPPGAGWTRYEPGWRAGGRPARHRAAPRHAPRRRPRAGAGAAGSSGTSSSPSSRSSSASASATRAPTSPGEVGGHGHRGRQGGVDPPRHRRRSSRRRAWSSMRAPSRSAPRRTATRRSSCPAPTRSTVNEPYDDLVAKLLKGVKPPTVKVVDPRGHDAEAGGDDRVRRTSSGSPPPTTPPSRETTRRRSSSRATRRGPRSRACSSRRPTRCSRRVDGAGVRAASSSTAFDANFAKVDMTRAAQGQPHASTTWSSSPP